MSWDLHVFTVQPVELADLVEGIEVEAEAERFTVHRSVRGARETAFTVDGPLTVAREDLPEQVAAAAAGLRCLFELSVPAAAPATVRMLAIWFARQLAGRTGGVVFDPQHERVVWPRSSRRRQRPASSSRVTEIELEWFFLDRDGEVAVTALFQRLRGWLPEALPRRFGDYEPPQHHFDVEGLDGMLALTRREGGVFWTATRPFLDGSLDLAPDPEIAGEPPSRPTTARPLVGEVTISVDGRWLDDEGWRADLIDGFGAVADRIGCIYGHAVATRNWGPAAGNCGADDHTETWYRQTIGRDRAWLGLPRNPVWLAWLGPPHRHLDVGRPHGAGRLFVADDPAQHADTPPRQQLPVADHWLVAGQGAPVQRAPSVPDGL